MEKLFHIHIDTQSESPELHRAAQEALGFYSHNFRGHPDGYPHFEPTRHSSFKTSDSRIFRSTWAQLEALISEHPEVVGYIEGEFIPLDADIPEKPIQDFSPLGIRIERRRLSSALGESFRETEIHVVMDFDRSDSNVVTELLEAGFYGALLDKTDHRAIVLTMQGTRRQIGPLLSATHKYLKEIGGVVRGSIKEERAIRHRLFNMPVEDLPEVAKCIDYSTEKDPKGSKFFSIQSSLDGSGSGEVKKP